MGKLTPELLRSNYILASLGGHDLASVLQEGGAVDVPVRHVIYEANQRIAEAIFPIDAVLSVVTTMREGGAIEVGTIGREGTSALPPCPWREYDGERMLLPSPGNGDKNLGQPFSASPQNEQNVCRAPGSLSTRVRELSRAARRL